jgi:kinase
MSNVEVISLSGNQLGPDLPAELSTLPKLQELGLSNCLFEALPSSLVNDAPSLTALDLSLNAIASAGLPSSWTSTTLTSLNLSGNPLGTSFPAADLAGLANLQEIYMGNCELVGPMPAEVGLFSALQTLDLDTNVLEGPLPSELGSISTLMR